MEAPVATGSSQMPSSAMTLLKPRRSPRRAMRSRGRRASGDDGHTCRNEMCSEGYRTAIARGSQN